MGQQIPQTSEVCRVHTIIGDKKKPEQHAVMAAWDLLGLQWSCYCRTCERCKPLTNGETKRQETQGTDMPGSTRGLSN